MASNRLAKAAASSSSSPSSSSSSSSSSSPLPFGARHLMLSSSSSSSSSLFAFRLPLLHLLLLLLLPTWQTYHAGGAAGIGHRSGESGGAGGGKNVLADIGKSSQLLSEQNLALKSHSLRTDFQSVSAIASDVRRRRDLDGRIDSSAFAPDVRHQRGLKQADSGSAGGLQLNFVNTLYRNEEEDASRNRPIRLTTIKAVSSDPTAGEVTYGLKFENLTKYFEIDANRGTLQVIKPLDRDPPGGQEHWFVTVTATQGDVIDEVMVEVVLEDQNDNAPIFNPPSSSNGIPSSDKYLLNVMENVEKNRNIGIINVTDHDKGVNGDYTLAIKRVWGVRTLQNHVGASGGGHSGGRTLEIIRPQNTFKLAYSPTTLHDSMLVNLESLDREKYYQYIVEIEATDRGSFPNTASQNYTIQVKDKNDNRVTFPGAKTYRFRIPEEQQPGTVIQEIEAHDLDDPLQTNLDYRLEGFGAEHFEIVENMNVAKLVIRNRVDYDKPNEDRQFSLSLDVTDGIFTDKASIHITVNNINDNAPVFLQSVIAVNDVSEATSAMTTIARVDAEDPDSPGPGRVDYLIDAKTDPEGIFFVDNLGYVKIQHKLDREKTAIHNLLVLAMDKEGEPSLTSTATIIVTVGDINDNSPQLLKNYHAKVETQADKGDIVAILCAKDADAPANGGPFSFTQSKDDKNVGIFSLNRVLISDHIGKEYFGFDGRQFMDEEEKSACGQGAYALTVDTDQSFQSDTYNFSLTICDSVPISERLCNETHVMISVTSAALIGAIGADTLAAILICVIILLILIVLLIILTRRRYAKKEKHLIDESLDDTWEHNYRYDEEGPGEEDNDAFDIVQLRKPVGVVPNGHLIGEPYQLNPLSLSGNEYGGPRKGRGGKGGEDGGGGGGGSPDDGLPTSSPLTSEFPGLPAGDVAGFIDERLGEADVDPHAPPYDTIIEFCEEGAGSKAGSLSSLNSSCASESGDPDQNFDHLREWGPRFRRLADLYGGGEEEEEERGGYGS